MCKLKTDKITYSKSQFRTTYDVNKNKPLLCPKVFKLGKLIDINKDNNFHESFEQFGGLELSSRSIQQSATITQ